MCIDEDIAWVIVDGKRESKITWNEYSRVY